MTPRNEERQERGNICQNIERKTRGQEVLSIDEEIREVFHLLPCTRPVEKKGYLVVDHQEEESRGKGVALVKKERIKGVSRDEKDHSGSSDIQGGRGYFLIAPPASKRVGRK